MHCPGGGIAVHIRLDQIHINHLLGTQTFSDRLDIHRPVFNRIILAQGKEFRRVDYLEFGFFFEFVADLMRDLIAIDLHLIGTAVVLDQNQSRSNRRNILRLDRRFADRLVKHDTDCFATV